MEPSSVAEQRATAVAKLKRAASLPRMKDGRRPPMHVEAVSEGERIENHGGADDEIEDDADVRRSPQEERADQEHGKEASAEEAKLEEVSSPPPPETPVQAENTPTRKRRSRSRTRSRGSRDMKGKVKPSPHASSASHTNESSADELYPSAPGDDVPPSPILVSPIPSQAFMLPASRLLASPLFYPGTASPTPLPTLDDLQNVARMGLHRSNSAGAARAMAMSKLTGEPMDLALISPSATPPPGGARLQRNNTVSGGERLAARKLMMNRLGNRINAADGDQTSGGEDAVVPTLSLKRRRRRSRRNSSRAPTVVDDREEREPLSTSPNTPVVPPSPLPFSSQTVSRPQRSPTTNGEAGRASPLKKPNGSVTYDYEKPTGHRGVVVEEDDTPEQFPLPKRPTTPARGLEQPSGTRLPHTSDAPSSTSTDSAPAGAIGVPFFLSASPFATPIKERPYPDDDEQVVYPPDIRSRSRLAFERESEISWVAEPLPVERPPVNDEDDEEEEREEAQEPDPGLEAKEGEELPAELSDHPSQREYARPHLTARTDVVVEPETSPEPTSAHILPSPISPIIPLSSPTPDLQHNLQSSPGTYPRALAMAPRSQLERTASTELSDWDERARLTDSTVKRVGESTSTWERVKNTFGISRSGSVNGRRSRANSISARDRRNNTDSSVSRDSRASLSKDKGEQPHPETQPPSASASMLSLPAGAQVHSPVPPATPVDLLMYEANAKLYPFPGLKPSFPNMKQEEPRKAGRPLLPSASNPDVTSPNGLGEALSSSSSNTATWQAENGRERRLSHQASDSRLLPKFNGATSPPPVSAVPSSASQGDYFNLPRSTSVNSGSTGSMKLPMNREGVKKWLSAKKLFSSQTSPTPAPGSSSPPAGDTRPRMGDKKPSLSDLLLNRKEIDMPNEWDEPSRGKSPTPLTPPASGKPRREEGKLPQRGATPVFPSNNSSPETIQSPRAEVDFGARTNGVTSPSDFSTSYPSPRDAPSSTTPDPQSSLDEFPIRSTSESYSDSSSSHPSPELQRNGPSQRVIILERLDEVLGRGTKTYMYPDDPPRKLVQSSPVLQVANANTVKDRFLFLFNDILVIAKPIMQDHDALLDAMKPSPLDRKFIVKSICRLRDLRLCSDRDESRSKVLSSSNQMRHPVIRNFVLQFAKDPELATATLFSRTNCRDDPALGQLLFRTLDLDRAKLGEYLSRRASKLALKAFVDTFGLTALRIDKALRVFLQTINIPARPGSQEYLLDSFASRWYEANAGIVAYDKDVAVRLVRAIVQLNEVMHGAIAQEPGITGYPRRNILSRDFIEAFRRYDPRSLVSDDLLDKIYTSVRKERLTQARSQASCAAQPDLPVTIKRPVPSRLTYRMQSEPIILRIPQPDPQLTIQLFGQDLVFDPPVLNFAKSSEASFRVTGTSLGAKTIIMWRSGPNGILYTGLPLSSPVVVERAFMRNTFQLAFVNHNGAKRKYMFSVVDPGLRHQWVVSIRRQIDIVESTVSPAEASGSSSKTYKANDKLAFRVLQETLISSDEEDYPSTPISPVDQALARLNGVPSPRHGANGNAANGRGVNNNSPYGTFPTGGRKGNGTSPHIRSKSRSKVYHRHGPGKFELELNDSSDARTDDEMMQPDGSGHPQQQRLWSGRDLEIVCRQNSLIVPMLAYLQADRGDADIAAALAS